MTTMKRRHRRKPVEGVSSVIENLHRVEDRDGLGAAREAARKMVIASVAKRSAKFHALVAAACALATD